MRLTGHLLRFALFCGAALAFQPSPAQAYTPTEEWRVCFHNFANVNQPTLDSMHMELAGLLHSRDISFEQGPCASESGRAVHVLLRKGAPAREFAILGRAPVRQGHILPVVEVYVEQLVGIMGPARCSVTIGRALARVAAHEVRHYIGQERTHSQHGLMREAFSGQELAGADSHPFRQR